MIQGIVAIQPSPWLLMPVDIVSSSGFEQCDKVRMTRVLIYSYLAAVMRQTWGKFVNVIELNYFL